MAAAGVAVYLQCVKGMLVMKKIDRPTFNKLTSELSSTNSSVVNKAAAEVMALVKTQAEAKATPTSVEPFSGLPTSPLMNIMFFLHAPELGVMAQTCKKLRSMVSRLRPRLFRVHAYRLLFDRDDEDEEAAAAAATSSASASASSGSSYHDMPAVIKTRLIAAAIGNRVENGLAISPAMAAATHGVRAAAANPQHHAAADANDDDMDDDMGMDMDEDGPVGANPHWLAAPPAAAAASLVPEEPPLEIIDGERGATGLFGVPAWAMHDSVVLPSMLSAFVRVFGAFADTPAQASQKRPALHSAAARAIEDEAWRTLVAAYTDPLGVSLKRTVQLNDRRASAQATIDEAESDRRATMARASAPSPTSSVSSSAAAAAAAIAEAVTSEAVMAEAAASSGTSSSSSSSSGAATEDRLLAAATADAEAKFAATIFGFKPPEPFPATTAAPPMDPFEWWRANRTASMQGRRRSLAALDAMQRLGQPLTSGSWLRLSAYVVPDVYAESFARSRGATGSMPGLGGTHSFIEGSSGAMESDSHKQAAASRTKQLPLELGLHQMEVAGERSQWLRLPFKPQLDTIFAWSRPPHASKMVVKLASSGLNDAGLGAVDLCRCQFHPAMSGSRRRTLETRVRQAEGQAAFQEILAAGGSETEALSSAQEAAEAAQVMYVPSSWPGSSPLDADFSMVKPSQHGLRVAVDMGLLGADLTRTAGLLLEGNPLAFFGSGGMEIAHNVAPSAGSASGPEMISSAKLNNNGIGELRRGIMDLPITALWWKVRLAFEQECDKLVIDAMALRF